MASRAAYKRLNKEYLAIQANPPPFITAKPLESNILEWHYVLCGPPDTAYAGGEYHGRLKFPADYPYKPPAIQMITPSGRFQTNTNICMSMSNYHPSTWNPAWSVATILNGMLSFMVEEEVTTGSIRISYADRRALARKSFAFNRANKQFCDVFPELLPNQFCKDGASEAVVQCKKPEKDSAAAQPDTNAGAGADAGAKADAQNAPQNAKPAPSSLSFQRHARTSPQAAPDNAPAASAPAAAAGANEVPIAGASRKWIILFVLLAYLFASKAVSRLLNA
ncbi:Ubiquitin-conjugating enzyme E2 6 [Coemansia erecta]|nr:Ubiquitin-conjugating enzyme E2 6 [Coemansia asiatica]KAJ2856498.1 Ubiquitin-conjugating enzyme E2 6 [Coemansia erecta]